MKYQKMKIIMSTKYCLQGHFLVIDILFDDEEEFVNEAGWLLLQSLKEEDLRNYQLLKCRREGGGEHRAEQSDCSS